MKTSCLPRGRRKVPSGEQKSLETASLTKRRYRIATTERAMKLQKQVTATIRQTRRESLVASVLEDVALLSINTGDTAFAVFSKAFSSQENNMKRKS